MVTLNLNLKVRCKRANARPLYLQRALGELTVLYGSREPPLYYTIVVDLDNKVVRTSYRPR